MSEFKSQESIETQEQENQSYLLKGYCHEILV